MQGVVGSQYFLEEWLVPFVLERYNIGPETLSGVIVTDNVLNYEDYEGASYPMPPALDKVMSSFNRTTIMAQAFMIM